VENRCASWCGYLCFRHCDLIFTIIIIRHELGSNRLVSTLSNGLFKALCVHLVYNSALLLAFCCCLCLLLGSPCNSGRKLQIMWRPIAQFWTTLIQTKVLWGTRNGVSEPDAGRCARARCITPESNCESCNSYLFLTHALCDSGERVWLRGHCVGVFCGWFTDSGWRWQFSRDVVVCIEHPVIVPPKCTVFIGYVRLLFFLSSQYMFIYCVPMMHKPRKTKANRSLSVLLTNNTLITYLWF